MKQIKVVRLLEEKAKILNKLRCGMSAAAGGLIFRFDILF
jgi:hypothetical protein